MAYWNKKRKAFTPEMSEDTTTTYYSDEQIQEMYAQGNVITDEDGEPIVVPRPEPTEEEIKENLRRQREALLVAFDKWEKAVLRGREEDSEVIMQWYEDLKELKASAFENVPERIKYYL